MIVSRFADEGRFCCPITKYSVAYLPPLLRANAPAVSLDTLQSSGGSFAFRSIDVTAKNGKPCPKCGGNEWYSSGKCVLCSREYCRRWRKDNPEKMAENNRRWSKENPERKKEGIRRWRENNPEKITAYDRQRRENEPEKLAEQYRRWWKKNPEKIKARNNQRRTLKTGAGGSYTAAEWRSLVEYYGGKCLCCGRTDLNLTADHVIPISKGGTSNIDNIQPLCLSCNSRKRDKTIDYRPAPGIGRWIQRKLFG